MTGQTVAISVNPTSGGGAGVQAGRALREALYAAGHRVIDLTAPSAAAAKTAAKSAVTSGVAALIVVGGDGMVNLGANATAGTAVPLGILAAGTGNDVARSLGLPVGDIARGVQKLIDQLTAPRHPTPKVDAVQIEILDADQPRSHWFVGVLSGGLDAAVNARANMLQWPRGPGRYVRALLSELRTLAPYGYRVTVDDEVIAGRMTLVCVANSASFGGGMRIAPAAQLTDGLLDVVLVDAISRTQLLRVFPRVYRGTHVDHPAVRIVRGSSVLLEPGVGPTPPVAFADGEPVGALPLRCTLRAGALTLLAGGRSLGNELSGRTVRSGPGSRPRRPGRIGRL